MIHMTFCNADGQNEVFCWSPGNGEARPHAIDLQLKEVLNIDVSGKDILHVKRNLGLPVANHRNYTRYQGDMATFIWDNI